MQENETTFNSQQLLLQIAQDIAGIKKDIAALQQTDANQTTQYKEEFEKISNRLSMDKKDLDALDKRIGALEIQNIKDDAQRWQKITAFVLTAIGGLIVAQVFPFVRFLLMGGKQ